MLLLSSGGVKDFVNTRSMHRILLSASLIIGSSAKPSICNLDNIWWISFAIPRSWQMISPYSAADFLNFFLQKTSVQVALKLEMPPAKKLLKAPGQTARASMKASQKAAMLLKRTVQTTVKVAKAAIKATVEAVKVTIAILKETIALVIAGGWVAVVIILVVCIVGVVVGVVAGELECLKAKP